MKIRAKNGEQTVDITLPATDMDIQYCMKCIGIEDIVPVCCISEVRDEPSYFGFLKGQTVNMDELNFFARRLDGMTEYEKRFRAKRDRSFTITQLILPLMTSAKSR